jgi:hypothetical protein
MVQDGLLFLVLALSAGAVGPRPAHADVNVAVTVGAPAPPPQLVVVSRPELVLIPGTGIYHAPGAAFNLFVFNGRYYSFHNGAWFYAASPRTGWAVVPADRVPRPLLAVPVAYYKVPPGHAKKHGDGLAGPPNGKPGKGRKHD